MLRKIQILIRNDALHLNIHQNTEFSCMILAFPNFKVVASHYTHPSANLQRGLHWPLCLATSGRVFVADPSTLGRHVCYVFKRSVCGGDEPQPVAHLSHKLQCARQSLKIMVSYGNKYPRHNARPLVVEQSGQ